MRVQTELQKMLFKTLPFASQQPSYTYTCIKHITIKKLFLRLFFYDQKVPFDHHFRKVANDIELLVPTKDFLGKAVIDWESWRPIFERNTYEPDKLLYINESKKLAKFLYPAWNSTMIDKMAEIMFEESARYSMYMCFVIVKIQAVVSVSLKYISDI